MIDLLKTTVSVCIPTYNQSLFIEQSVRSAFNQTYKPIEIIVCDDASTDDTLLILNSLKEEIPILKVLKNCNNLGITNNVNKCLKQAIGDLVVRLDSDDVLNTNYIEKFVPFFEMNPNIGYGHCSIMEIDQDNNILNTRILYRNQSIQSSIDALKSAVSGYKVAANIIIFRRSALQKVGFIQSKINFAEDYYLVSSISEYGYDNVYINQVLANYRIWIDKNLVRSRRKLSEIQGLLAVFNEVLEPAFIKRGWSLVSIRKIKKNFAVSHSDCLSWNNYSFLEKLEIEKMILNLSSSNQVKIVIWLYKKRLGLIIQCFKIPEKFLKTVAKKIVVGH